MSQTSQLKHKLANRWWRLNNLYYIQDENGHKVLFQPNGPQTEFLRNRHYLSVILKARQLGFCVDPESPVLLADLTWRAAGHLQIGDEVVSADEYAPGGKGRQRSLRRGVIERVRRRTDAVYRIRLEDGRELRCTGGHRWYSWSGVGRAAKDWRSIECDTKKKLRVGHRLRHITSAPWSEPTCEDGWFAGFLDGEGSVAKPESSGCEVNVAQVEGDVLDRATDYLETRGYSYRVEIDDRKGGDTSKFGNRPVHKLVVSRIDELMRLIGTCQPSRICRNFWEGKGLPGKRVGAGWVRIESIDKVGTQEVIDIQTSTATFVCNGLLSHNSTCIQLDMLDRCLFNTNWTAGIVAQDQDTAADIMKEKLKFAYSNLPEALRERLDTQQDSTRKLALANGSSVTVGTSLRGGTFQQLHVSEYGTIAASAPGKAREIKTGAFNTIAQGQIIDVESTAKGNDGEFYELVQNARATCDDAAQKDRPLHPLEWKFNFYPWWRERQYETESADVTVTSRQKQYFDRLVSEHGIELSDDQKAWYALKENQQGAEDMRAEFPSHADEAFEVAIEGAYYARSIREARQSGRLTDVPHTDQLPVCTAWDLGMSDATAIWFFQVVGREVRVIDYYEASDAGLAHYVDVLQQKNYRYDRHFGPHDLEVRELAGGGTRARSRREIAAEDYGLRFITIARVQDMRDGREAVRQVLPLCWFDQSACADGVKALENYKREWLADKGTYSNNPRHDWASHGAKAFETMARSPIFHRQATKAPAREIRQVRWA